MKRPEYSLAALLPLSCALAGHPAWAANELETVVVTAVRMTNPLRVETDPKQPRQPLPAHDGAEYLKTIPGFNVVRKGGTDGDPLFRGMAASRLNILLDGESLSGGCSSRMDPPTAYVFPEAYDRITVIKGPQTVKYGPGNSAATVLFERDPAPREHSGWDISGSVTAASFGRNDEVLNLRGGSPELYASLDLTRAEADDYDDGDGNRVHSAYERWSSNAAIGWTPDADTYVELHGAVSDGEAAYADRLMDGAAFERENVGIKFSTDLAAEWFSKLEGQAYYNYIDHVMDNYSLRDFQPSMMMPYRSASNPDRETTGGRVVASLQPGDSWTLEMGTDAQFNTHSERGTMNQDMVAWQSRDRIKDAEFSNVGVFAESDWTLDPQRHIVAGLRLDNWEAEDHRDRIAIGMMGMSMPNPSAGESRSELLTSGFVRYETNIDALGASAMIGVGHVQRFPDYWELVGRKESSDSISAFDTEVEKTTQLDIGLLHKGERLSASLNLFANDIKDYILIESAYRKGMRLTTVTRNVDARTWGAEAGLAYAFTDHFYVDQTLAWVRGDNETDGHALAQQPPLESRTSLNLDYDRWNVGVLMRMVDDQDRYALNQGNVVGQDLGPSDGFVVFSINAGWKPVAGLSIMAGVDNLLDETYAEHVSRGGAMVPGYQPTERVNEPGRTAWLKVSLLTP